MLSASAFAPQRSARAVGSDRVRPYASIRHLHPPPRSARPITPSTPPLRARPAPPRYACPDGPGRCGERTARTRTRTHGGARAGGAPVRCGRRDSPRRACAWCPRSTARPLVRARPLDGGRRPGRLERRAGRVDARAARPAPAPPVWSAQRGAGGACAVAEDGRGQGPAADGGCDD